MSLDAAKPLAALDAYCGDSCATLSAESLKNCHEFEKTDLDRLVSSADSESASAALTFLWTDLGYPAPQPALLVRCAVKWSAHAIVETSGWADPSSNVHGLCERLFEALALHPTHANPDDELYGLFADVLVCTVADLQAGGGLEWVPLANSCCAIWPRRVQDCYAFLEPSHPRTTAALHYICALVYATQDHPWAIDPVHLWERYGAQAGVRWGAGAIHELDLLLSKRSLLARLHFMQAHVKGLPQIADASALLEEIIGVQLDVDLEPRRQILLHHLSAGQQDLVWNDEWGIPLPDPERQPEVRTTAGSLKTERGKTGRSDPGKR